jgi:hypothetical protein
MRAGKRQQPDRHRLIFAKRLPGSKAVPELARAAESSVEGISRFLEARTSVASST